MRLWVEHGRLKCDAPPGVLDDGLRAELTARREELLALVLHARTALGAPRSLVPLKPTGALPPLFARPGHNGDVFCYRDLAQHLDAQRPLYGVEPKGLDGIPTPDTVEEIAAYEVEQIRGLQAKGPYYLAGYCAGGTIAFESARQLLQAGEEVARVVLFGSPFPTTYRTAAQVRLRLRSLGDRVRNHAATLVAGSLANAIEHVRRRAREREADRSAEAARRTDPALANQRRVEDATMAAVKRYAAWALRGAGGRLPAQQGLAPLRRSARGLEARGLGGGRTRGPRRRAPATTCFAIPTSRPWPPFSILRSVTTGPFLWLVEVRARGRSVCRSYARALLSSGGGVLHSDRECPQKKDQGM